MNHLYFIGIILLAVFFAFFKMSDAPLQDGVESRNGVNAIEMLQSGDFTHLTYGEETDKWHNKPPLSIWMTAVSFRVFGYNTFALRLPMALATILLFFFLYRLIRLYQDADFAFYSCLMLLSVKGLVGRHIGDFGEYDALFTCFAVAGTYYFLQYFDFKKPNALYYAALCFGLSFLTKGFGVFVFLLGILIYMIVRRQFRSHIFTRNFLKALTIFLVFPLFWLAMNGWQMETTLIANLEQDFLSYTLKPGGKDWLLVFNYLNLQYQWWHYLFYLAIPVGFYLIYLNQNALETNFTTQIIGHQPQSQLPKNRIFTISDLLAREDLKPNIQLLMFSISIWLSLALVCTMSQNEQYLAFALPFIAITTAACVFYFNHRFEWFRFVFIALLVFAFGGQLDDYVQDKTYPKVIMVNEDVLQNVSSLALDSNLPAQNVLLYLRFIQPGLNIITNEDNISELVFCPVENRVKYEERRIAYEDDEYVLLVLRMEDRVEM